MVPVMDVPAGRNVTAGIKPHLAMQACTRAVAEVSAVRVVITASIVAFIDDTAIFNDLDHMILPCGTI
jgi:hypothetical protein